MAVIAPWLSVKDATEALAYYRAAFGAIELERLEDERGDVVVAQHSIGGADFWIQADAASSPDALDGRSVRIGRSAGGLPPECYLRITESDGHRAEGSEDRDNSGRAQ